MTFRELMQGIAADPVPAIAVTGLTCHSKSVRRGDVFVAVRGTSLDGHAFVDEAVSRGASAVVVERLPGVPLPCPVAVVPSTKRALVTLAARWHGLPAQRLRTIGITGTNGKTTTSFLIKAMLEAAGARTGLLGTVVYEIGRRHVPSTNTTPGALELQRYFSQMVEQDLAWCVMEISSHALDQGRIDGVQLDAAVWTCLGSDHLDYHRTMDAYAAAKRRIFTYLKSSGRAVINQDDASGARIAASLDPQAVVTYALEQPAQIHARTIECTWRGISLLLQTPWGAVPLHTPMIGRHNIPNILAACGACLSLGVPVPAVQRALADFAQVPGRMEPVSSEAGVSVLVDYAHTADALRLALLSARELARGRLIVVFGCGGNRDQSKRPAMGQLAGLLADHVVLTSDNPRHEDPRDIIHQIKAGFAPGFRQYQVLVDREQAITAALSMARSDDMVLIAGKGHEAYQVFDHVTVPFSDREVVERYWAHASSGQAVSVA